MTKFVLPQNWIAVFHSKPRWLKPFGWFTYDRVNNRGVIEVWKVAWIPTWFGLQDYFAGITYNHEALHAWGNRGCKHIWCLGFEGPNWKEYLAMPIQLFSGLRFCEECMGYYHGTTDSKR